MKVTDFIYSQAKASFKYYRANHLYYHVYNINDGHVYSFPIPIEDVGNGTLQHVEKAVLLMRWIRSGIEEGTMIKVKAEEAAHE